MEEQMVRSIRIFLIATTIAAAAATAGAQPPGPGPRSGGPGRAVAGGVPPPPPPPPDGIRERVEDLQRGMRRGGPGGPPNAPEPLGTKQIEGVNAKGVRRSETIPAGTIGNDRPITIIDER